MRCNCATARAWVAGFAQGLTVEVGHLVGADDHAVRVPGGHRLRLGQRQPAGQWLGGFIGQGGLVHIGGDHGKRQAQPLQQLAAVNRGGSQNQVGVGGMSVMP